MNKNYQDKIMKIFKFAIKLMGFGFVIFIGMCIYMMMNLTDIKVVFECIKIEAVKMFGVTTITILYVSIAYGVLLFWNCKITEEKEKNFMIGLAVLILIFLAKAFTISFFDEKYISELRSLFDNIMTGVISASLLDLFRC